MNVLIVDDQALIRHGVAMVVEESFPGSTVREASTETAALAAMKSAPPDIALVEIRLSADAEAAEGLTLLRSMRATWPDVPVLILTASDSGAYAREAMASGAAGYLLKDSTPADLARAIKVALEGGSNILSAGVISHLFDAPTTPPPPVDREAERTTDARITDREVQILELVIEGQSNREIADVLGLSDKTVKSHLATLYRKMNVANRTQAAMAALAQGIGSPANS